MIVGEFFVKLGLIPDANWAKGHILIGGITKAVRALASAQTINAIKDVVSEVVDLGGNLQDTADAAQLNVEELQELGYVASQSGGDIEGVAGALEMLTKNMYSAANGNKAQAEAFARAGVAIKDESGRLRPAADVMGDIADHLQSIDNESERRGAGVALMGKQFSKVAPMMFQGAEAIQKAREEARALGVVMSSKEVGALDDFGDDMGRVSAVVQGLKQQFVVALLPALQKMLTGFTEWIKTNRELAAGTITKLATGLATALGILAQAIVIVVDNWKAFAVLLAAGAVISGIMSIIKMVMFFSSALTIAAAKAVISWVLILGPILLIAAALVLLGVLIYKHRDRLAQVARRVREAFSSVIDWFTRIPGRIKNVFVSIGEGIKTALYDAFTWVGNLPIIKQLRLLVEELNALGGRNTKHSTAVEAIGAITGSSIPGAIADIRRGDKIGAAKRVAKHIALGPLAGPIAAGSFIKDKIYGGETVGAIAKRNQPMLDSVKARLATYNNVSVGDINVTSAATDPVEVGKEVRKVVREEIATQSRHAVSTLSGGE
jgi:hypothetical protein